MGTGKKNGKSTKSKTSKAKTTKSKKSPEKDLLKEKLNDTGPFVLRDFCSQHGMDASESKKAKKSALISFLIGKFDEGEITMNDLYPEEDPEDVDIDNNNDWEEEDEEEKPKKGKKEPAKKRSSKKSKTKDDDDDDLEDNDDDDDDSDDDLEDNDDDDLEDNDNDDLEDDDDDDDGDDEPKKGKGKSKSKDSSALEDKIDKLIDLSTKLGGAIEQLSKVQVEHRAFLKLAVAYLMKQGGLEKTKVAKLVKKWEAKAKEAAGTDEQEDE